VSPPLIEDIFAALMTQIAGEVIPASAEGIQVSTEGHLIWSPTPPSIDVYPAEEFQSQESFGLGNTTVFVNVRARVNTPEHDGAQSLILSLMDPRAATSVQQAILSDQTLSGNVEQAMLSAGPSNYGIFPDPSGQGSYLGCTWTVRLVL